MVRPFYFNCVFWGKTYRQYFLELLVASLLSPQNLPALNPARKSQFLIVTTIEDWNALQSERLFLNLKDFVEPVWFEMPFPQNDEPKMLVMSKGHQLVSSRTFADQAYGIFVTPDLVLSDGSILSLERLAERGKKVVLSVAIRFAQESLLEEMKCEGYFRPGSPMVLPPRELMRMALRHLHSETLRYEFDAPYFAQMPISVYWKMPREQALIIYSFSWAPLLVDYGGLKNHDVSTFDNWTLDGDYISRNFPNPDDVHVVTDSDEIALVSFTKESDLHFDLQPDPLLKIPILGNSLKIQLIRSLKDSSIIDDLKRTIFQVPVVLHANEISDPILKLKAKTAGIILRTYTSEDKILSWWDRFLNLSGKILRKVQRVSSILWGGNFRLHLAGWVCCRIQDWSPFVKPILSRIGLENVGRRVVIRMLEAIVYGRLLR